MSYIYDEKRGLSRMKKTKKVMVGAVVGGMMFGSLVTYAGTQLTWGGEDDINKISAVIDGFKSEISKRDELLKNGNKDTESMQEDIDQKTEVIAEMDKEKETLDNHINELSDTVQRLQDEAIARDNEYNDSMAGADEEYMARIEKLESKIKEIQFEKETLEVAIGKANEEKTTLENKYQNAVSDYTDTEAELNKANEDINALRVEAEEALAEVQSK